MILTAVSADSQAQINDCIFVRDPFFVIIMEGDAA